MKIKNKYLSLLAISLMCVACSDKTSSNTSSSIFNSTNNSASTNNDKEFANIEIINNKEGTIIAPEDVNILETYHSLENKKAHNYQVLPSIGDINILVIPILIPNYSTIDLNNDNVDDSNQVLLDIEKTFFGENNEKYESVKTFYQKSSYGKLNLGGEVTEWFDLSEWTNYKSANEIDYQQTFDVVKEAVNWAKNIQKIDMSKYDNDKDGYIDGVWCIYSCPNQENGGPKTDYNNYWAYTNWGNIDNSLETPNVKNPIYNLFGWASYDFMYDGYGVNHVDAHTFIHETGHFLGLNDYYSDQYSYNPIGKIDMMDANIGDLNSYSKMLLGWTKPYIVTSNADIDLKSMHNKDSLIVIPGDSYEVNNNNFDPFSEYILIEYYTNDGLNYLDSLEKYSNGLIAPKEKGIRIYHIDNRKFLLNTEDNYNIYCKEYDGETLSKNKKLILPITNKRGMDNYNYYYNLDININMYDEIRMIEASNIDTFSNGGVQKSRSLFKENDSFSMKEYGKNFFYNGNSLNNGDTFSYEVKIKEVK